MLLPAEQVLRTLLNQLPKPGATDSGIVGSDTQSADMAIRLLKARACGGGAQVQRQCRKLASVLCGISESLPPGRDHDALGRIEADLAALQEQAVLELLEAGWRRILGKLEICVAAFVQYPDSQLRSRISGALASWEAADLQGQADGPADSTASTTQTLDAERWTAYLRKRFNDVSLTVSGFRPLAGGFGKQTFLFDVSGQSLSGSFVIRRDLADPAFDNDCHHIHKEYPLIRAMRALEFPAPEALWLDTDHADLPGGDFIVMRRSPGVPGGSVFAARDGVPADLSESLAKVLARLHTLPAMPELGELTDSIAPALWDLPRDVCVRRYLDNWLSLFQREPHLPSPTVVSQLSWLREHVPKTTGRPVLLHGDIGFHNFLFDQGQLTAVLDWEFAHLGDPAEDLAYVRNTLGATLDWNLFMSQYRANGGAEVETLSLHFFQVWGHLRNACASNMMTAKFAEGRVDDLKLILLPHAYIPNFLAAAQALIDTWPGSAE